MIEVQNISKSFGAKKILDDVSCSFTPGIVNLVIGGSGSGKTVMMKCLVGLFDSDEGKIFYDGRNFSEMNFKERRPIRQEIGMVFQGGALFDSMNVESNVSFPLRMFTDLPMSEIADRVNTCLARVNLVNANKLLPSELSGGMKKRVAIARAVAMNPKYLFCDEPNSGLDPKTSIVIDELIEELTEEYNMTTVVNTHDMNSVADMGENIIFLHKGKKWWEGTFEEILSSENPELNEFIFASKVMQVFKRK